MGIKYKSLCKFGNQFCYQKFKVLVLEYKLLPAYILFIIFSSFSLYSSFSFGGFKI